VFHAGRSLLSLEFRDFDTFSCPRRGCARFFTCPANESAKRFAGDIEARVGEPLPDLSALEQVEADLWIQYAELGGATSQGLSTIDLQLNGKKIATGLAQGPDVAA
jgi:hypothetical protein